MPPSFALSAAAWILRSVSEATCSVKAPPCERPTSLYSTGPRSGSSYAVSTHHRLIDPIRPTRGHVPTSPPRLIWDAFAVRERLGDPRVVPRFRLSILPSMSSSTSPGSRPLHVSSSFAVRICLRRRVVGSALPMLADVGAYWFTIATTCWVARLPYRRLLPPGFQRFGHPPRCRVSLRWQLDNFHRRDSHPLDRRLASLHNSRRFI